MKTTAATLAALILCVAAGTGHAAPRKTYLAAVLRNDTAAPVHYKVRWGDSAASTWVCFTLQPGASRTHVIEWKGDSVALYVHYDRDARVGKVAGYTEGLPWGHVEDWRKGKMSRFAVNASRELYIIK